MLRFGTVGSNWIADEYIKGAKDSGLWELKSVYSRTKEKGSEYAKRHGAENVFTDIEEMATSGTIDAVYIASPNFLHFQHSKIFLENGIHVICEKPLSSQSKDVKELAELASTKNLIFLEAIMYMHLPQRKILEDALSKIGNISIAKIDYCQRSSRFDSYLEGEVPNVFNPEHETGAFMDLGVYCVFPALQIFGLPESYDASATFLETGADANGIVTLKYPDKLVTLTYSKIGQAKTGSEFQGNDGTVYVDSISRLADISVTDKDGVFTHLYDEESKYKLMGYESKDFYSYITEPEKFAEEYEACTKLSLDVSEFMQDVRNRLGIKFNRDN